jgi:hypothetical protein
MWTGMVPHIPASWAWVSFSGTEFEP